MHTELLCFANQAQKILTLTEIHHYRSKRCITYEKRVKGHKEYRCSNQHNTEQGPPPRSMNSHPRLNRCSSCQRWRAQLSEIPLPLYSSTPSPAPSGERCVPALLLQLPSRTSRTNEPPRGAALCLYKFGCSAWVCPPQSRLQSISGPPASVLGVAPPPLCAASSHDWLDSAECSSAGMSGAQLTRASHGMSCVAAHCRPAAGSASS